MEVCLLVFRCGRNAASSNCCHGYEEEVRIPILGVDIGFDSDIGSIAGGLFLVVGVDGKFTLEIEARQWVKLDKVGLKGKCAYYVPYTIGPLLKVGDNGFDLDSPFRSSKRIRKGRSPAGTKPAWP